MAKTKQQKDQIIKKIIDRLKGVKSLIFVNFDKLTVKQTEDLRRRCEKDGIKVELTKKTLLNVALKQAGIKEVDMNKFDRGTATVFAYDDEVTPAKILTGFAKEHEALKMYGGLINGNFVDSNYMIKLSQLPTKPELLSKLVGSIKSPISGLVYALKGNLNNLVYVLQAIKDKK